MKLLMRYEFVVERPVDHFCRETRSPPPRGGGVIMPTCSKGTPLFVRLWLRCDMRPAASDARRLPEPSRPRLFWLEASSSPCCDHPSSGLRRAWKLGRALRWSCCRALTLFQDCVDSEFSLQGRLQSPRMRHGLPLQLNRGLISTA